MRTCVTIPQKNPKTEILYFIYLLKNDTRSLFFMSDGNLVITQVLEDQYFNCWYGKSHKINLLHDIKFSFGYFWSSFFLLWVKNTNILFLFLGQVEIKWDLNFILEKQSKKLFWEETCLLPLHMWFKLLFLFTFLSPSFICSHA